MRLKKNESPVRANRTTLFFFLPILFFVGIAIADPENFMVGPLTFVRPAGWEWKDPEKATKASAELRIVDAQTHTETQLLVSSSPSTAESVTKRWKGYFTEPPAIDWHVTTNTIQSFTVTYVTISGTQRSRDKIRPDYMLFGAHIAVGGETNVYGRLLGPQTAVQKLIPEFKNMVQTALLEQEKQ